MYFYFGLSNAILILYKHATGMSKNEVGTMTYCLDISKSSRVEVSKGKSLTE